MGLKFKVTAKDGKTYSAEKIQPTLKRFAKDAEEEKKEEKKEELVLSEKEIKLLKELAEKSGDLLALLEKKGLDEKEEKEAKPQKDGKEEEEFEFEEEEEFSAKDEDVVDFPDDSEEEMEDEHSEEGLVEVDEDLAEVKDGCSTHDSKKSFGAIENKRPVEDSLIDSQEEINACWANRYNKKGENK